MFEAHTSRPSSTITAATLAGAFITLLWTLVDNLTEFRPSPELVSASTTFVMAIIGYFKKENVYNFQPKTSADEHEQGY